MTGMGWVPRTGLLLGLLSNCSGPVPEIVPLPSVDLDGLAAPLSERLGPVLATLADDPLNAEAAGMAGMLLLAYEQHHLAAEHLARARMLDPGALRWEYYLGVCLAKLGRHAEAADSFRRCGVIDAEFLPARWRLGDALLESGETEAGRLQYQDLVADMPEDARLRYGLGRAEAAAGRAESARDHLRKAIEVAPDFGMAHYALAQAYRLLGVAARSERHLELYERNRDGEPATGDPLMAAVQALRVSAAEFLRQGVEAKRQGRIPEAIQLHLRALDEDPALIQARVNLIILYGSSGQPALADEQYRLASSGGGGTAELHYNFGVLAYETGRPEEAREAFRKALAANPDHALANHNLGQMLEEEGRLDEAMARYRRAVANRPDHGLSHYKIGMLLMRQRRASAAVAAFREATEERSERTPTYLFSLAAALLASGDREGAIGTFRQARDEAGRASQGELVKRIDEALRTIRAEPGGP